MAELVLNRMGGAIGGQVLPQGANILGQQISGQALGQAIGSLAGAAIDARYLTPPMQGPRVKEFHLTESREGASIPVVYGRCRVGAQVIWATEFREHRETHGGKGGPPVSEYSYSLSFAVALCEGEVSRVSRCWANGVPFDLSKATWRLYKGTEDQAPDPLIEAIEGGGSGGAPAYRGVAYIVFEELPVDQFGGRMPQLSFEVVRPAGGAADRLEAVTRAVNIIPGTGEFALATDIVRRRIGPGRETAENMHSGEAISDFEASLDQLEAELPNVTRVNLVVGWFGNDLRCGECEIRPGVEISGKTTAPQGWSVVGIERGDAYVVSQTGGKPNYGGTPSDESVRQAITALKVRGYHVTLYPFLLMDIPAGNGLPDPYGGAEQAAFPWRGRITIVVGDAGEQIEAFFETYRDFVLHYAALAEDTGADGLLIGSELVGLTRVKIGDAYPAVDALVELASDVRGIVGGDVEVSYAADWTEYAARVDGADLDFPLDGLWTSEAISYVGLDWYPPMADWRDGDSHADVAWRDGRSRDYLATQIAGGEAFEWYYADEADRAAQVRLPITDSAYGEPWVFRQKDVAGWWSHVHHSRVAGVRSGTPTAWIAGMKPVRLVEMGVPAADKGANQPNVFYDRKSSESALPHFSNASRDDVIQRNAIEAFHAHWDETSNPESEVYEGRMIPEDGIALWAWDARPYPAFPADEDAWSDGGNWRLGHWLNGRVGVALLRDVAADVCAKAGATADASGVTEIVSGYRFDGPTSARSALEPLMAVHGLDATERNGSIVFRMRGADSVSIDAGRLVEENAPPLTLARGGMEGPESRVRLRHVDAEADQAPGVSVSAGGAGAPVVDVEAAISFDREQAQRCANALAEQLTLHRERARFAMGADGAVLEAGDVVRLGADAWRIVELSDGGVIRFEAVRAGAPLAAILKPASPVKPLVPSSPTEPGVAIVDGPALPGQEDDLRPLGFAFTESWTGAVIFSAGADASEMTVRGRIDRPCMMGWLVADLSSHASGRWQEDSTWISVPGALATRTESAVLNGANAMLVETEAGWELVQYHEAELVELETYKLTGLLRGQQGTELAMSVGATEGARVLFLTGAEARLEVESWERGLALQWTAGLWEGLHTHHEAGGRMWSPAHFAAEWSEGDLALAWTRRARTDGDPWLPGEPPNEVTEGYRIQVSGGGMIKRQWDVADSSSIYPESDQATDFPGGGGALIEVAQLGRNGEPGDWAALNVEIPA
ncbi:MAG: glycoside hydrolase/phage tail family protein [Hyphomonadaceae bacterium]|nr:glycoside hydrolase/phage tail family protein [Hyphomonadaceae bacterium]